MDAREVETWADRGTERVWRDLHPYEQPPLSERAIWSALRAAYAQGYQDALTEPSPTIRVAMERAAILDVLLPVQ